MKYTIHFVENIRFENWATKHPKRDPRGCRTCVASAMLLAMCKTEYTQLRVPLKSQMV